MIDYLGSRSYAHLLAMDVRKGTVIISIAVALAVALDIEFLTWNKGEFYLFRLYQGAVLGWFVNIESTAHHTVRVEEAEFHVRLVEHYRKCNAL